MHPRLQNTEVIRNINLTYNPDTGVNYPFTDLSRRAFPDWGLVNVVRASQEGYSNDYALQTSVNKRFSANWQVSGTYTLGMVKDADSRPVAASIDPATGHVQYTPLPFQLSPDIGGEYTLALAVTDQRHRATVNGVWELPFGFQVSGLYFYGSGMRFPTAYGGDTRNVGSGRRRGHERTPAVRTACGGAAGDRSHDRPGPRRAAGLPGRGAPADAGRLRRVLP